jgi:hypothetical protein
MVVKSSSKAEFIQTLEVRMSDLVGRQVARVKKVIKEARSR